MSWTLLIGLALGLTLAVLVLAFRRSELARLAARVDELRSARERGSHKARLSYPYVDLSRCLGCGACVRACPEEGVLDLIHGQALVVHGARCVGHGLCAKECPTGAIVLTLGELDSRRDIPALDARLEVPGSPGLFLGGEVSGFALIRTAIGHGTAIAAEVARRRARVPGAHSALLDLCIVGAGPAGLACALEAKRNGLRTIVIEQDELGGTVAKYPRKKLVLTQPVELPLHGRLKQSTFTKEELIELWQSIAAEHALPIHSGVRFQGLAREADGSFQVDTDRGRLQARNVALTLGRRGAPRRLGVPGEELAKVAYGLIDAQSHRGQRILVVGGGDSAIEAALALAEQPDNEVTLSYRQPGFVRLKRRNEEGIAAAQAEGRVRVLFQSQVLRIGAERVELSQESASGTRAGWLANDEVFVLIGGEPPFALLERCGVSFDPRDRLRSAAPVERGTGLFRALAIALGLTLLALAWLARHADYYFASPELRPLSPAHEQLHSTSALGLGLGIGAALLILANLTYLLRRHGWLGLRFGTLRTWMVAHVLTGVLSLLLALVHGAMSGQEALGTSTLQALAVLVASGAVGRYLYSYVPRAANGRELELAELESELATLAGEWEREHREFGARVQAAVQEQLARQQGTGSLATRLGALFRAPRQLRKALGRLRTEGRARGIAESQLERLLVLARRAHRTASVAAQFEDLRGLVGTWRHVHRWAALFLVLVLALHVLVSLRFGQLFG